MATSCIVERLFSRAKLIMTPIRRSMDPSTLENILMLKFNSDLYRATDIFDKILLPLISSWKPRVLTILFDPWILQCHHLVVVILTAAAAAAAAVAVIHNHSVLSVLGLLQILEEDLGGVAVVSPSVNNTELFA